MPENLEAGGRGRTTGRELAVESVSDVPDNVRSRGFANRSHHIGDRKMQAGSGEFECYWFGNVYIAGATKFPFAPAEILMHRDEMSAGNSLNEFGLAQPLLVGADFIFGHGGKGIYLAGNPADRRISEIKCTKVKKGVRHGSTNMTRPSFRSARCISRKGLIENHQATRGDGAGRPER